MEDVVQFTCLDNVSKTAKFGRNQSFVQDSTVYIRTMYKKHQDLKVGTI